MACVARPVVKISRFEVTNAGLGYRIPEIGPWEAIAIGAESDVDRCIIVADGAGAPIMNPSGLDGSVDRQNYISDKAFAVSVERPWIGPVNGPLNVLLPYAKSVHETVADGIQRLRSVDQTIYQQFLVAGTDRPLYTPRLELYLYPFAPGWLPTKRAPLDFVFRFPQFGTTGETTVGIYVPTFGRRSHSLSIEMTDRSAGSIDWSLVGANMAEPDVGGSLVINRHDLQATTTEAADFDRTYFFDGEFDFLHLTVSENAALNAGVEVQGIFKAWD